MKEAYVDTLNRLPTRRLAAVAGAVALALVGCGGNTKTGDNVALAGCGVKAYNSPGHLVSSKQQTLATAAHNVLLLQARARNAGGSIDLPRYDSETEVVANKTQLKLSFVRSTDLDALVVDHVNIPIKDRSVELAEGAVMCFDDSSLVTNGTFETLRSYVQQTAALDR